MIQIHDTDTWGITLAEYEAGGWGSMNPIFKIPASITRNYTFNGDYDREVPFKEVANMMIMAIASLSNTIGQTQLTNYPEETQKYVRFAIYNAIQHNSMNRSLWENVNGSSISGGSFNIQVDSTAWLTTDDMLGKKAWTYLTASRILDYSIVVNTAKSQQALTRTALGNILLIELD